MESESATVGLFAPFTIHHKFADELSANLYFFVCLFVYTFSCWALRFEFQQNSSMATTIAMASPHSRTTNTPPVVVPNMNPNKTDRRSDQARGESQGMRKERESSQTDNRSLIRHSMPW